MDKLNEELIAIQKRLLSIEHEKKALDDEYALLQDKIHYYLDSSEDTIETENYIISDFWSKAYLKYKDGGYITNDEYTAKVRFDYENRLIEKIIQENCQNFSRALDIGCGNGRYTKALSHYFDASIGMDLSQQRVDLNNEENNNPTISYINKNFMDVNVEELGLFDFVFVGDIFMYTNEQSVEKVYSNLLKLVKKDGVLLVRESTRQEGSEDYKSKNYVAYYRHCDFYTQGIFEDAFKAKYRNPSYNLYHLDKYFHLFPEQKLAIEENPILLDDIVAKTVNNMARSSNFYIYKKKS